jgi:hypothetical protein
LGDMTNAGNGAVLAFPGLARFGMHGRATGGRTQFSVQDAEITPNQHEIARRWAFSDNFYVDGQAAGGMSLKDTRVWDHVKRGDVTFRNFDEAEASSDQSRAEQFITTIERQYGEGGEALPQLLSLRLTSDGTGEPRPQSGYPYEASFVADNDLATGKILEYLSHSRWWPEMAVFVTESDTQGSLDHVDADRTLFFAAGPYVKRNYVSHTNAGFGGLLRTVFELLRLPPLDLVDATASGLGDMFTGQPDFSPYAALPPDARIFDPAKLR